MLNRGIIYREQMSGIVYFANEISHSWYKKILQIKSFRLNMTFFSFFLKMLKQTQPGCDLLLLLSDRLFLRKIL